MNTYELYYTDLDEDVVARKECDFTAADISTAIKRVLHKQPDYVLAQEIDIEEMLDRAMIDLLNREKEFSLVIEPA